MLGLSLMGVSLGDTVGACVTGGYGSKCRPRGIPMFWLILFRMRRAYCKLFHYRLVYSENKYGSGGFGLLSSGGFASIFCGVLVLGWGC